MLYLLDAAIEVAENYANDEDAEHELAAAVDMSVMEVFDEESSSRGRGINIYLPHRDTGADPAICQVIITEDGEVVCDSPFDEATDAEMILDQIEDAHSRIKFCEEALHNMGFGDLLKKPKK